MFNVIDYIAADVKRVYLDWLDNLRDENAAVRIARRVQRLYHGNFGDCKPLKDGVWELRIDYGPGYRVYYGMAGKTLVLLLCGGDKRKQNADIERAVMYLKEYKRRTL